MAGGTRNTVHGGNQARTIRHCLRQIIKRNTVRDRMLLLPAGRSPTIILICRQVLVVDYSGADTVKSGGSNALIPIAHGFVRIVSAVQNQKQYPALIAQRRWLAAWTTSPYLLMYSSVRFLSAMIRNVWSRPIMPEKYRALSRFFLA
jgi:hypothetical protein